MKIGVITPTRGLIFTRVEAYLEGLRINNDIIVYRSWDKPIPDGHNDLTDEALRDGCNILFFLEEDVVPPAGAFEKMLAVALDGKVACVDYGVSGWGCITRDSKGEIRWCGLGCTLVPAAVFGGVDRPWFRTDKVLRQNDWTWQDLPKEYQEKKNYGGLDIWFFCQARNQGFEIVQIEGEADHLRLVRLGERETNHGLHEIALKERISKNQMIKGGENF